MEDHRIPRLCVSHTRRRLGLPKPRGSLSEQRAELWRICRERGVRPVGYHNSLDIRLDRPEPTRFPVFTAVRMDE